jgi:Cu+-exporting ATPase
MSASASPSIDPRAGALTAEVWIPVGGMTCAACQSHVQGALARAPGVTHASVSLVDRSARVAYDTAQTTPEDIVHAIEGAGYEAELVDADADDAVHQQRVADAAAQRELRALMVRAAVALPAFLAVMFVPPMVALGLTVVTLVVAGGPTYVRAFRGALRFETSMSTLVAIGTLAALAWSAVAVLAPGWLVARGVTPSVYLEPALAILAFVLVGQNLEARARRKSTQAITALATLLPRTAIVRDESAPQVQDHEADVRTLRKGDLLVVRPGTRVPADAIVVEGTSSFDESLVSGEAEPVARGPGDPLVSGSLNGSGAVTARVTSVGKDSTVARIVRLVREAQASHAPTQALADRVSARFVPGVLALSLLTLIGWLLVDGSVAHAVSASLAVLIVACPCAMGLAVPTAIAAATSRSAELGVLWKSAAAMEAAARVDMVVLDKTGTITAGAPQVVRTHAIGADADDALAMAAAVERASEHPIARAIVARAASLPVHTARDVVAHAGGGVEARVARGQRGVVSRGEPEEAQAVAAGRVESEGSQAVAVGSAAFVRARGVDVPAEHDARVIVAVDGVARVALDIEDAPRPEARAALAAVRALGAQVRVLSGDRKERAIAIAREVGVADEDVVGDAKPADKLAFVDAQIRAGKTVMMVGDGINDAPVLARAHVGVAMGSGSDTALAAADASLPRGLASLAPALSLARRALRVMKQNLAWAFAYNVLALPVAALGVLSPTIAGAAMAFSSVSVVLSSLRLLRGS